MAYGAALSLALSGPGLRLQTRLRLRQRLMISVTLLLGAILLAATLIVVGNAHSAISDEMDASVKLATDLIQASLSNGEDKLSAAKRLDSIRHLRHLCISLVENNDARPCPARTTPSAPAWFAAITRPSELPEQRIQITASQHIRILADPDDEINESWHDARGLLALLLVFYLAVVALVYLLMGRALIPVRRIDEALQRIEYGDFSARLPRFTLPEFDGIAAQFNHMAATLESTRADNHRLRDQSLLIQEDERRNLARELHDELGQSLTAIRADAAGILAGGDKLPAAVAESASAIAEVAAHIYDQARLMMRRLRPPGLDELGLAAALEDHVTGWQRCYPDIDLSLRCDGDDSRLPPDLAIHVFRLVQEALTNALRHAKADGIEIDIAIHRDHLKVRITDDGRGFDPSRRATGLGIYGMRERIELLEGNLKIESALGLGTRVKAHIKLK